jgi:hypothetical protein
LNSYYSWNLAIGSCSFEPYFIIACALDQGKNKEIQMVCFSELVICRVNIWFPTLYFLQMDGICYKVNILYTLKYFEVLPVSSSSYNITNVVIQ